MSTGARCSRCSGCSCSRSSKNGTGDSESPKSSLFCTCTVQPATATPATAATPCKGLREPVQTIGTQHRCRAAGRLLVGLPADAQKLAASVELTTDVVRVPSALHCFGFGILERSGRVSVQPCPHGSADPASLWTLHPVAFLLLDLGRLAACGHLLRLHRCSTFLPAESHLVAVLMHCQGYPFARDACGNTSPTRIHSLGVGRCRLLHVVLLFVDDNAITGCVSEKRQAISPESKEQQIPYLTDSARKRLELFQIFTEGRQRVSLLHASRRNRHPCQRTSKERRNTLHIVTLTPSTTRCSAYRVRPSYYALMATNAQHQASYRTRQTSAGSFRLDTHISGTAHKAIANIADREGVSQREVIERLALAAEARNIMGEDL